MGARVYDPYTGTFLQPDPLRQGPTPYGYTDGDPVNKVDLSGDFWMSARAAVLAGKALQKLDESADIIEQSLTLKLGANNPVTQLWSTWNRSGVFKALGHYGEALETEGSEDGVVAVDVGAWSVKGYTEDELKQAAMDELDSGPSLLDEIGDEAEDIGNDVESVANDVDPGGEIPPP
jgi:uncharacterized protein RhaS with RHS repeats